MLVWIGDRARFRLGIFSHALSLSFLLLSHIVQRLFGRGGIIIVDQESSFAIVEFGQVEFDIVSQDLSRWSGISPSSTLRVRGPPAILPLEPTTLSCAGSSWALRLVEGTERRLAFGPIEGTLLSAGCCVVEDEEVPPPVALLMGLGSMRACVLSLEAEVLLWL